MIIEFGLSMIILMLLTYFQEFKLRMACVISYGIEIPMVYVKFIPTAKIKKYHARKDLYWRKTVCLLYVLMKLLIFCIKYRLIKRFLLWI